MIKNLMHLSMLSLLSALVMVINGCGEDNKKPEPEKDKFKLGVIQQFEPALMNAAKADNILVTEDKKLAYVLDNQGKLWRVSLGDDAHVNMHDKTKWQLLEVVNTGLDGSVSQAKLDQGETHPNVYRRIHLTKDGVVVTGLVRVTTYYIAYIKHGDDKALLAWMNDTTHVDGSAFPAADSMLHSKTIIAEHDNKTYVVLVVENAAGTTVHVTSVALEKGAKIKGEHKLAGATFPIAGGAGTSKLTLAAEKGSNATESGKLFFVDVNGVTFINLSQLGSNADAAAATTETASDKWRMNTTFVTVAGVNYGAGAVPTGGLALKHDGTESVVVGSTGVDNNGEITGVVIKDGKLLISLNAATHTLKNYTGGVVIYDIANNKTEAPKFGGIDGPQFTLVNGLLYHIANDSLNQYDDNGKVTKVVVSSAMIKNNVYSKKEVKLLGLDDSKTFFMIKDRQGVPGFSKFAALGEDLILYNIGGDAYSLYYRDVELPKKVEEELPEQE